MLSEETLRKYFEAVVLSNYSPGEMGWLWKEFLLHKDILENAFEEEYYRGVSEGVDNYISIVNEQYRSNLNKN